LRQASQFCAQRGGPSLHLLGNLRQLRASPLQIRRIGRFSRDGSA
jgi:hypothetical protein